MKKFKTTHLCVILIFFFDAGESHPLGTSNPIGDETTWEGIMNMRSYFNQFQFQYYAPLLWSVSFSNTSFYTSFLVCQFLKRHCKIFFL